MRPVKTCAIIMAVVPIILLSIATILAGCHTTPALTAQEAEGKHLYAVRCAHCHDDNDLELKKVPPNLHGLFAHTTLPSGAAITDQNIERVVLSGKGLMPAFTGDLPRTRWPHC